MATTILNSPQPPGQQIHTEPTERDALLPRPANSTRTGANSDSRQNTRHPFFKPNPYWVVPFWLLACFSRGMTLAPRVEVYTHLACAAYEHQLHRHPHSELEPSPPPFSLTSASPLSDLATFPSWHAYGVTETFLFVTNNQTTGSVSASRRGHEDKVISRGPSKACLTDPTVQQYAARLQTVVILIMGTLSALTTGWWGGISDRLGRTKVMAIGLLGYLFTDFMFVVVARNARWLVPFGGHHILVLGPIMEGLAGGFTTVTAAVNSYVSDVTAHGSRSNAFSRMQGILFIGVAAGPAFSSILLKWTTPDILVIFTVSLLISLVNAFYAMFLMPESLTDEIKEERERKRKADREDHLATHPSQAAPHQSWWARIKAWLAGFVEPLALFLPQGNDWRLTLVGIAFFTCFLTVGLYPLKLLYAEHRFGWTSVEMGSYLTIIGALRAAHLLVIIPTAIKLFKPVHPATDAADSTTPADISTLASSVPPEIFAAAPGSPASTSFKSTGTPASSRQSTPKPGVPLKVSEATGPSLSKQMLADIRFDLNLARLSLAIDAVGYVLVVFFSKSSSEAFVLVTLLSAFGGGSAPAMQSASLCLLKNPSEDSGKLFGAFSMIQAVAAFIISPLLFGLMYSETVRTFPEAMFLCGGILLAFSCISLLFVRPALPIKKKKRPIRRGRSTRTKALSGSRTRTGFVRHQAGPSGLSQSLPTGYGTEDEV
ncbi:hypothetical protein M407DRAFT_16586 [Tulasnella calospora MUT 4182]|uniref:Major facilitator superfamily (MFS) profile domain-containing protein n=1 Tax=Tulasnella calospora MUT 4182 TaxID=1051891 RepID=A0A0C3MLP6_9AGAM|nr:hypothetical protein M407DRAFT_16586 [Tulasnella calospora MUT 4182]